MSGRIARALAIAAGPVAGGALSVLGPGRRGGLRRSAALALCAATLAVLGACTAFRGPAADGRRAQAATFPSRDSAWLKDGVFVNLDDLRQMIPGMTKPQVYDLLGPPHFDEGVFRVRVWNYIFNFRTGHGNDFITCQYQLRFDENMRTEAGLWNRRECAEMVFPRQAASAASPSPVAAVSAEGRARSGGAVPSTQSR